MNKNEKNLSSTRREDDVYQTAFSLLNNCQRNNCYQDEDAEFVLYFASLIGQELDLPPSVMATLRYGPLLGTSAKIELDVHETGGDLVSDPAKKIAHYRDSPSSIFASETEDFHFPRSQLDFSENEHLLWPDYLEDLEEEIDVALDVLMVADIFNRLVNAQTGQNGRSIMKAVKALNDSPPENLNPQVISALNGAVEKRLKIH